MCGIAGVFGNDADKIPGGLLPVIARMCEVIEHRGPDDAGYFIGRGVAIGMRRLSIIDLAGGRQPLANEDASVRVVFNGEIYNYKELRRDLVSRGHRFSTGSDTEVIVHLYEEEGERCVEKLRGMFAFAVYDRNRQSVLLARDRLGIKPLNYAVLGDTLIFGSEIKSILQHPDITREPNLAALSDFLTFGYIPDPETAFRGIRKLGAGQTLTFTGGSSVVRQYWSPEPRPISGPRKIEDGAGSQAQSAERLLEQLKDSVGSHLVSDVPVGAFLSGGIDSSAVVALMSGILDRPVKTFSIGFDEASYDELEYARMSARRFNTDHHEFVLTPDLCTIVEEITWHFDEPFADYSSIPTYLVSKLARDHVKVILSGDGSDELFAGYDRYQADRKRRAFDFVPALAGRQMLRRISRGLPNGAFGKRFLYNISLRGAERYIDSVSYFNRMDRRQLLSPEMISESAGCDPEGYFLSIYTGAGAGSHLDRLLYLDTKTYLAGDILTKVDRMTMANSIEARVPFLDHKLVEAALELPASFKLRRSISKYVLKDALRGLLPEAVIDRPKQGFDVPMGRWLKGGLREMLSDVLMDARTRQRGYFNEETVNGLVSEHLRGRRDHSRRLWELLTLELWHRLFVDRRPEPKYEGIKQSSIRAREAAYSAGEPR
jgi:asparagine synthase (glutamine-hydrolysing)